MKNTNKTKMGLATVALIGLIALAFAVGFRQGQLATVLCAHAHANPHSRSSNTLNTA